MTLVPLDGRPEPGASDASASANLRIGFNRDESRQRAAGRPPELRKCGARWAIMPIDPVSDGTWIAVNDAGLAAGLLNRYDSAASGRARQTAMRSRGELIPMLMECATIEDALALLSQRIEDITIYAPFSLVLTDGRRFWEHAPRGGQREMSPVAPIERPRMFTSSGLGDELVRPPRSKLFKEMFRNATDLVATQDAFHRHQWPDHPELSVCMARPEARTVSFTAIEINGSKASLTYHPCPPNESCQPVSQSLSLGTSA